jgi:O-antigen/teichoic acid export membrane protein
MIDIKKYYKNPFIRNVATLATGTALAQGIAMFFAPIITRLYGPESYGLLGVFLSIVTILTPIVALSYPIAIVLPKKDSDAKKLIRLSIYVGLFMTSLISMVFLFFHQSIIRILQLENIASFLFLIPLVLLFNVGLQVTQQWMIRKKLFNIKAKVTAAHAFIVNSVKVGIGFFYPFAVVLVSIATFGYFLQTMMLFFGIRSFKTTNIKKDNLKENDETLSIKQLASKHKDFPLFRAPQVFLNAISQSLPVLLLASFFGPASAGFYALCRTILALPSNLLGQSVQDVFYPKITEAAHNKENTTRLIVKATLGLSVVGFLPFALVVGFGPLLFGFVFGAEWLAAGNYARWLALWLFTAFINRPSVAAIPVLNLQKHFLIYEIISIVLRVTALMIGFYLIQNDIIAIMLFSIAGVILNSSLIVFTIHKSKKYKTTNEV